MKKTNALWIGLWSTGGLMLGFIPFFAVFEPYWLTAILGHDSTFPNIAGGIVAAVIIIFPLFLPYFVVAGVFSMVTAYTWHEKYGRILMYLLALLPFFLFNFLIYIFLAENVAEWVEIEGYKLFILGVIFIILPTVASFIFICEKYYFKTNQK